MAGDGGSARGRAGEGRGGGVSANVKMVTQCSALRLIMFYRDKQGKKWELRNVRASESVPQFVHAEGGDSGTRLHLHVDEIRVSVVPREGEAKA